MAATDPGTAAAGPGTAAAEPVARGAGSAGYAAAVAALPRASRALPADAPVRLAKPTSNLFRTRTAPAARLDVSAFTGVLSVDPAGRTAEVLGMTTYEQLVDELLPHGLMPLVVPQLKTITLGGAVTGMGVESTSFRHGAPHESVLEMDILTGDGRVVTATPDGEHAALFYGFPNSYGTLGYALRLRIECQPVRPYVALRHRAFTDPGSFTAALARYAEDPAVDFLDATAFAPGEYYLTTGCFTEAAGPTSEYTHRGIYYRSLQTRTQDRLTVRDYLWRWDTDWFWCSRAFGAQRPWVRTLLGPRRLRSDTYWHLVDLENRYRVKARLDRWRGLPDRESVIQDVEVPVARLPELLAFLDRQTGIRPVWVCPMRVRDPAAHWPLYPMQPGQLWVNVGFWSTVALPPGERPGYHNRRVEEEVSRLGGCKSLYSTSFYSREEFRTRYGGQAYDVLKKTYDPDGRLLDLYQKTVLAR